MGTIIRRSLKKKKSSTNSANAADISTGGGATSTADGLTTDQVFSDGEEHKKEEKVPLFKKRGRNMQDMMN